jgi:hypothetical protein
MNGAIQFSSQRPAITKFFDCDEGHFDRARRVTRARPVHDERDSGNGLEILEEGVP